jgi:ribosome recycling factor
MEYLDQFQKKIDEFLASFKEELATLRTNRPNPKLIENILVDYLGQRLPLKQLGSITVEPPRDLIVTLWDKGVITPVVKAIEAANLGVGVATFENMVRVKLPELTSERRLELGKIIKSSAEAIRIKMRKERDYAQKKINEEPSKDQRFKLKEELQKKVDAFNQTIDELVEKKMKEIAL